MMNYKNLFTAIALMAAAVPAFAGETAAEESHWTKKGNAALQFTQGFVSKNWYKGGQSSFSLLATGDYTFNYKQDKFTWDNMLEGKLGFVNSSSQYRTFITNQDILRWTSKVGYEAGHNWFYTLQGIGQTQFCTGWKDNGADKPATEISKFFNPATLNVSLGMDWKKETEKVSWTVFLGPVAYNLKFVSDPRRNFADENDKNSYRAGRIDATAFGIPQGQFNAYDLGATGKAVMSWKACKYLTWTSQATYFSPLYGVGKKDLDGKHHGYTNFEWQNTFDMPLNKFFSTKVFTHLRFDDSVGPAHKFGGWGYFQFTELLSFGISYNW